MTLLGNSTCAPKGPGSWKIYYTAGLQGVECNSEAALHAISQGRGRATGCANLTAAETIAAQRCLRNSACSKPLGHAGFCDNGKPAAVLRHNPLAGLAAVAEQASNGSAGNHGQTHHQTKGTSTLQLHQNPSFDTWLLADPKLDGGLACQPDVSMGTLCACNASVMTATKVAILHLLLRCHGAHVEDRMLMLMHDMDMMQDMVRLVPVPKGAPWLQTGPPPASHLRSPPCLLPASACTLCNCSHYATGDSI